MRFLIFLAALVIGCSKTDSAGAFNAGASNCDQIIDAILHDRYGVDIGKYGLKSRVESGEGGVTIEMYVPRNGAAARDMPYRWLSLDVKTGRLLDTSVDDENPTVVGYDQKYKPFLISKCGSR